MPLRFLLLFANLIAVPAFAADILLPLERSAYFVGELIPAALTGAESFKLEARNADGVVTLHDGKATSILIDAAKLAPGEYALLVNGEPSKRRLFITSVIARSAGSMQDESRPNDPQFNPQKQYTPAERAAGADQHWDRLVATLRESKLSALFPMGQIDCKREPMLDALARAGVLMSANPDSRPTSFLPIDNHPLEQDGMAQRIILAAQANGRYPNFGGFCLGWDTTGYAIGNRKMLLTYWGWGDKTEALRKYIGRIDAERQAEFRRRTGLEPVSEAEYIAYLLSIKRPEFATLIDLPTRQWLNEISRHTKPLADDERAAIEKRLDAWSAYLMGLYAEGYGKLTASLREVDPTLRNTASVQIDHSPVRFGQYFPSAYQPLDLQYQSTWNDQVGGPDYAYQWLYTAGLLDMHRGDKPTWLSNAFGPVHARAETPGKFTRVAAHGLPWGVSGIGFALEGFSNLTGGMNSHSHWTEIKGKSGGADVVAGREFLDRFACLALEGRGDHGVGILFSKSQYQRQHVTMGFGASNYQAFVLLTRLGYTPRFVTEEELVAKSGNVDLSALLVLGQTFPLPAKVTESLDAFAKAGGRVIADDNTTVDIPAAKKLGYAFSFTRPGKPHNWGAPNMPAGDNDALIMGRWEKEIAPHLVEVLGDLGRGVFKSEAGLKSKISLLQIDGGADVKYVVAVNDSHIKSQADWFQVRETLTPTAANAHGFLFDCTEEKSLGKFAATECDLTRSTARVFAVVEREPGKLDLRASQNVAVGDTLGVSLQIRETNGNSLRGVIPFCLTIARPDGVIWEELYRSTNRDGNFSLQCPLPANVPAGTWTVSVRSQWDGRTASLPIKVAAKSATIAAANESPVFVRNKVAIEQSLKPGAKFVLPLFDERLAPIAEKVKQTLSARGVEVEIQAKPTVGTYWLAYDLSDERAADNAKVERGEVFGKIKRETTNGNDWYAALSEWRYPRPLILLDLVGEKGDCPPAESLDGAGMLWPRVTAEFPGKDRAVVEGAAWAFAPRTTTIVLRAWDADGLSQAATSLAKLPDDPLLPRMAAVKESLWKRHHVGGRPTMPELTGLTNEGLKTGHDPKPFRQEFPQEQPPTPNQVAPPAKPTPQSTPVPAEFTAKQFVIYIENDGEYIESATADVLVPDLRFSDAIQLHIDAPAAGKYRVAVDGLFRFSDRKPCWQAQWEDIIELREKLVPKDRRPMSIEVRVDGKPAGKLEPAKQETKEVPLELASPSAGLKPRTAAEEVVTQLAGVLELPAGKHRLLLIHRNVVDGRVEKITIEK